MGRWYLTQLENGCGLEDAAFHDLQIQEDTGRTSIAAGPVVFQQPEMELYQRLVEASRNRMAELECGIERSKLDSVRSKLFAALRAVYRERDRLRLLVQFRGGATRPRVWFSAPSLKTGVCHVRRDHP